MIKVPVFLLLCTIVVVTAQTSNFQKEIFGAHNAKRTGEPNANLKPLKWSAMLASSAQGWADKCIDDHGQVAGVPNPKSIGQSIFSAYAPAGTPPPTHLGNFAVDTWFSEKKDYDFAKAKCNKEECKHYTAIVAAKTTEVGCGHKRCPKMREVLVVCNYLPIQDPEGTQPYKKTGR